MPSEHKEESKPLEAVEREPIATKATRLGDGGIRAVQGPDEQTQTTVTESELSPIRSELLEKYDEHKSGPTLRGKIGGDVSEELYSLKLDKSGNLNEQAVNVNQYRNNFPLCDVSTPAEMTSVKAYVWNESESARNSAYTKELTRITGTSKPAERGRYEGMRVSEVCAERFGQIRQEEPQEWQSLKAHLPQAVAEAVESEDRNSIAEAIEQNAVLAVPDDHVNSLRAFVERNPESAGIDPTASEYKRRRQIDDVLRRIGPIGTSSEKIRDETLKVYQSLPQT